jgi:hypothetical protein
VSGSYVPIFFQPGWLQERYQGWQTVHVAPGLKILRKSSRGLTKVLILSLGKTDEEIESAARGSMGTASIGVLHEFGPARSGSERRILGRSFIPIAGSDRMLNTATFAVDLSLSTDELFSKLEPTSRNKVRKAQSLGAGITVIDRPAETELDGFYELFLPLSRRAGIAAPDRALVEAMFSGGNLLLTRGHDKDGASCLANLVYRAGDQAYYLHGATAEEVPTGLGQLAQWETMLELKRRGLAWYDLGGVPPGDPKNGIYAFKASLGGDFVDLGAEFRYLPPLLKAPYLSFRRLREMLRL